MAKYDLQLDRLFHALGDPTRRAILQRLASGQATVTELAAPHDMALPSLMSHIRKLQQAGLVVSTKSGRVRTCALAPNALEPAQDWLSQQRSIWENRLDQFDDYIMTLSKEKSDGT